MIAISKNFVKQNDHVWIISDVVDEFSILYMCFLHNASTGTYIIIIVRKLVGKEIKQGDLDDAREISAV